MQRLRRGVERLKLKAFDPVTLAYRVQLLLRDPQRLAEMAAKARALGKPDAASEVLARVLAQPAAAQIFQPARAA
ncbi:hypothetical protein [Pseudoduganella sp. UC29_71]|uniref:hypothetical protein n=1 Tax=Pseudoduganella sp. UC29_71 TaxID=3350174 RepID=UPI00366FE3B0